MADQEHATSRRAVLRGSALGAGALFGAAGFTSAARAATGMPQPKIGGEPVGDQYFLKLDGIDGAADQKGFEKWIELTDFSWGASRPALNGESTGKAKEVQVHFTAPSSIASPLLMLGTVSGNSIKNGSLYVANNDGAVFIKGEFTQILISSYEIGGIDGTAPLDQASLAFGKIKFTFYGHNEDGSNPVSMVWDLRSNKV